MFTGEIKRSRSKTPLYIGLVIVAAAAAVILLVPMPRTIKTTAKLVPIASVDVQAPRAGTIAQLIASEGAWIEKGGVIAKYDAAEADKKLKDLEAQLAATQKKLTPAALKASQKGQAGVTKAEADLTAAKGALEKAEGAAKGKKTPAVTAAEKKAEAAAAALEKAKEAAGPGKEQLEQEEKRLTQAVADAKAELDSPTLVAPSAGLIGTLTLKQGPVTAGAVVARLDDITKLKATVAVPAGEPMKVGAPVDLFVGTSRRRVTLETVAGQTGEATVDNAKKDLKVGDVAAELTGEPKSLSGLF